MKDKVFTRRDFLKSSATAAFAGALFMHYPGELFADPGKRSRVVLIRDADVFDKRNQPRAEILQSMLDRAVKALTGEEDPRKSMEGTCQVR